MHHGVLRKLKFRWPLHENISRHESFTRMGGGGKENEIESVHWTTVGRFDAPDRELMDWARQNNHMVFTHDLDFGTALTLTKSERPSVIQVRTQNVTIERLSGMVIAAIKSNTDYLLQGALLILDEEKQRIRILPL